MTVSGPSGTAAQTNYAYDQSSQVGLIPTTGLPSNGYGTAPGTVFGHATTTTDWLNTGGSNRVTQTYWLETGKIDHVIDARNNTTSYTYDSTGNFPAHVVYPATGATVHQQWFAFDPNTGKPLYHTDQNGSGADDTAHTTSYSYDSYASLIGETFPDGGSFSINYNGYALPLTTTTTVTATPNPSQVSNILYDGFGRVSQQTSQTSLYGITTPIYTKTTYDLMDRVASVTNPFYNTGDSTYGITSFTYDVLNRKLTQQNPDSTTKSWAYAGSAVTFTDESGNKWQDSSDGLGRLTKVLEPNGTSTTPSMETDYTYDALSDLLSVTQWGGPSGSSGARTRQFTYDSLGRLLTAVNPETGSVGYTYDANGNLLTKTDARSIIATSAYDVLNRVLYHSYSDGTPTACFQYDVAAISGTTSNLIGQVTGEWTQPGVCPSSPVSQTPSAALTAEAYLQYDSMGRAKLEKYCTPQSCNYGTSVSAVYDFAGDLASLTYPDGRTATQSFDPGARLSGLNFAGTSYLTVNSYDAPGHLTSSTMGNGIAVSALYNPRLEITSLVYGPSASPIWSRQYAWTPNGNLQQAVNLVAGTTRQYGYDTLNRLTSALDVNYGTQNPTPGGLSETYGDDPFGNLEKSGNFTFMPGPYSPANQLPGWSYDASGDLRQDALGNIYIWDANGMTSAANGINYFYDAEGSRVGKSGSGATDTFYFGGRPIARLEAGAWTDLVYGAGGLLAEFSSVPVYRMTDLLGSAVGIIFLNGRAGRQHSGLCTVW